MSNNTFWYLSQNSILKDLDASLIQAIADASVEKEYPPKQLVYSPSTTGQNVYFVKRGYIHIYSLGSDGRKIILDTLSAGDIFGYSLPDPGAGQHDGHFAECSTSAHLCILTRDDFQFLLAENPQLAVRMIESLSIKLMDANSRLRDHALLDAHDRLLGELMRIARQRQVTDKVGNALVCCPKPTHEELGERIGVSRETITRTLTLLREEGRIQVENTQIVILE